MKPIYHQEICLHTAVMILGSYFPEFSDNERNHLYCPGCKLRADFPILWHLPHRAAIHLERVQDANLGTH